MFPVFNNFSETPCMKVGLDVRVSSSGFYLLGGGEKLPSKSLIPSQKKFFLKKKLKRYFKC